MATDIGTLTSLVTNQAYIDPLQLQVGNNFTVGSSNFTLAGVSGPTYSSGGYSGQLIHNSTTNEYILLDRGTATFWSNLLVTDGSILLGSVSLGFNTAQLISASAYATQSFQTLANQIVNGETIGTVYLAGHSSGYAQAITQYETLLNLYQSTPVDTPENIALHNAYGQLLTNVQVFGVNGAGVPFSSLPVGSLDSIALNLILPGDIVDNAGQQYGIQISLDGAGYGYVGNLVGATLGLIAGTTPLGLLAFAAAGGIAGNHFGGYSYAYLLRLPSIASATLEMMRNYNSDQITALAAVDPFTWQGMSSQARDAMHANPVAEVAILQSQGLTPTSITQVSGGIRYTFANGVNYTYQNNGVVGTYTFSPVDGNPIASVSVYSDRTEYHMPDNTTSIVYNNGDAVTLDGAISIFQPAGGGPVTFSVGGQNFSVPATAAITYSGDGWLIQDTGAGGLPSLFLQSDGSYTSVNYNSDNDTTVNYHNAQNNTDTQTSQIGDNVFLTTYNANTGAFNLSINGNLYFSANISGATGNDTPIGGACTIWAVVNGQPVEFSAIRTGTESGSPGSYLITGVNTVNGAPPDPQFIEVVDAAFAANGYRLTDVADASVVGGISDLACLVGLVDATGQAQTATSGPMAGASPDLLASFYAWSKVQGSQELAAGVNGAHTLLTGLRTDDIKKSVEGIIRMTSAYNDYLVRTGSMMTNDLSWGVQGINDVNAAIGLRSAFMYGGGKAIALATANATQAVLSTMQLYYQGQATEYLASKAGALAVGDGEGAQMYDSLEKNASNTASTLGTTLQNIGYALAAYNASQAINRGRYWDAVFDVVACTPYAWVSAIYFFCQDLFGLGYQPSAYAWGQFANNVDGTLDVQITNSGGGGEAGLYQLQTSFKQALNEVAGRMNGLAAQQAALPGTSPVEMGILGSRLQRTRMEVSDGYIALYNLKYDGTIGKVSGFDLRGIDNDIASVNYGQNIVEVFMRQSFENGAILPMWDIETVLAQETLRGTYADGLVADIFTRYKVPYAGFTTEERYRAQGLWLNTDPGKSTDGHAGNVLWQSATAAPAATATLKDSSLFTAAHNSLGAGGQTKYTHVLNAGDVLHAGESISSSDGRFLLQMRTDGDLVLLDQQSTGSAPVWHSGTGGSGNYAQLTIAGALAVYSGSGTWIANANNILGGKSLTLQDNGILTMTDQADNQSARVIAIDLNGDGEIVKSGKTDGVLYDIDNDGYVEATEWLGPKDGLLVLDRDGDGQIDGGHELFNDSQVNLAGVGLNVLKEIDTNYVFKLNADDFAYNYLQVWQDINHDGVARSYELKHLADLNITEIDFGQGGKWLVANDGMGRMAA